ncbi:MAG: hypothetical protein WA885_09795 [Phormidesmis sp.]
MKRQLLSTLTFTAATLASLSLAPTANAAESKTVNDIHATRLEFLDSQSKSVDNIQKTRLAFLENQTKAVDNVQTTRLEGLDVRAKRVTR